MKKMKKIIVPLLTLALAAALASRGKSDAASQPPAAVTVTHSLGTVSVPYNPRRVAILDLSVLDMLDAFGLGDRVVGVPKGSTVSYLASYNNNPGLTNLGNLKEVDMEKLNSSEPDVIFIGGRLAAEYDNLSKIAPVVLSTIDNRAGYMTSFKRNAETIASIFGMESRAKELVAGFDARLGALAAASKGKTAIVTLVTSGSVNTLGNGGRCSIISNEAGFTNLAADVKSTHGDSASFELLLDRNPDYIFVLDRDAAINAEGSKTAKEVLENDLVKRTDAFKKGRIVYLSSDAWYLAEGGITATDTMIADLEKGVLK
jgi:iron complex transport system substrate-binding protein